MEQDWCEHCFDIPAGQRWLCSHRPHPEIESSDIQEERNKVDPDTMQLSASVIDMIREGDMDEALGDLSAAITLRKQKISGEKNFQPGQTVKVIGRLRPNYLFGHTFTVLRVLNKTCEVEVPMENLYRRYKGTKTRIPKTALEIV